MAHIWACPPSEGDDYIFHCHPPEQKIPKPKRLQDWYRKMLDKAIMESVVFEYKVRVYLTRIVKYTVWETVIGDDNVGQTLDLYCWTDTDV